MGRRWEGVLSIQGELASESDRRIFEAFTWRELPLTLRLQTEDFGGHDGAAPVGRIDTIELRDGRVVWGEGEFSSSPEGELAAQWVEERTVTGVSVDPGQYAYVEELVDPATDEVVPTADLYAAWERVDEAMEAGDEDGAGEVIDWIESLVWQVRFTAYEIAAATIVATPAFAEARIAIVPDEASETVDDPELVESVASVADRLAALRPPNPLDALSRRFPPRPTLVSRQRADFAATRTIAAPGAVFRPSRRTAAGPATMRAPWFQPVAASAPIRWTITDVGRIMGHLFTWNACHRSFAGRCETPERQDSFDEFHTGQVALDDGSRLAVGCLTYADLHADEAEPDPDVLRHLMENTGRQLGPVRLYADEFGVQSCGQVHPDVAPEVVARALAGFPSGDWRDTFDGSGFRLYGVHIVNTPGYPWREGDGLADRLVAAMAPVSSGPGCGCGGSCGSCGRGSRRRLSASALADLRYLDSAMAAAR